MTVSASEQPEDEASVDWSMILTDDRAAILESYFSLFQTQDPKTIGSGDVVRWFREHQRTAPSESLIRTVLGVLQLPRRGTGRPAATTREAEASTPFLSPLRSEPPRRRRSPPK